jgi:hypothetical protein
MDEDTILAMIIWTVAVVLEAAVAAWVWKKVNTESFHGLPFRPDLPTAEEQAAKTDPEQKREMRALIMDSRMTMEEKKQALEALEEF